jgi:hypothetical protein
MCSRARDYHRALKYEGLVECGGVVPKISSLNRCVGPSSAHKGAVYSCAVAPAVVLNMLWTERFPQKLITSGNEQDLLEAESVLDQAGVPV